MMPTITLSIGRFLVSGVSRALAEQRHGCGRPGHGAATGIAWFSRSRTAPTYTGPDPGDGKDVDEYEREKSKLHLPAADDGDRNGNARADQQRPTRSRSLDE